MQWLKQRAWLEGCTPQELQEGLGADMCGAPGYSSLSAGDSYTLGLVSIGPMFVMTGQQVVHAGTHRSLQLGRLESQGPLVDS